jgi:hypothetical protein
MWNAIIQPRVARHEPPGVIVHRHKFPNAVGVESNSHPALQHDPNRPEDVLKVDVDEDGNGNGGDDTADSLRYLIGSKGRTVAVRKLVGV